LFLLLQVSAVILSTAKDPEEFKFAPTIDTFHPTLFPARLACEAKNQVADSSGFTFAFGTSAGL
jgi:hypothetical protein